MKFKEQEGFSLIELLITVLILTVGLLAMAMMHVMAMDVNTKSRNIMQSTILAQKTLEDLMVLPYDNPKLNTTDDYVDVTEDYGEGDFDVFVRVRSNDANITNTKIIDIKVEWEGLMGAKRTDITCVKAKSR